MKPLDSTIKVSFAFSQFCKLGLHFLLSLYLCFLAFTMGISTAAPCQEDRRRKYICVCRRQDSFWGHRDACLLRLPWAFKPPSGPLFSPRCCSWCALWASWPEFCSCVYGSLPWAPVSRDTTAAAGVRWPGRLYVRNTCLTAEGPGAATPRGPLPTLCFIHSLLLLMFSVLYPSSHPYCASLFGHFVVGFKGQNLDLGRTRWPQINPFPCSFPSLSPPSLPLAFLPTSFLPSSLLPSFFPPSLPSFVFLWS
jgi:hypothetical protein